MIQNFFGMVAFITSIIGLFPQVYKALQTRSTNDISMLMLLNFLICSFAWIIYGAYTASFYVEASNVLGLVSCIILMILKWVYDAKSSGNSAC